MAQTMAIFGEPVGGEEAILWHLEQIDYCEWQASMTEACDADTTMIDELLTWHTDRLKVLEDKYPETAKTARAIMEARYKAMREQKYQDASFFQVTA